MNKKVLNRRTSPKISKECLADYAGLNAKKVVLVIIEECDDDELETFPAATAPGSDRYLNLATGQISYYANFKSQNVYPAHVSKKDDVFLFRSWAFARRATVNKQELKRIFGNGVII